MPETFRAWFLYPGKPGDTGRTELVEGELELPALGAGQVLVEPLFGAWGANMDHALARQPVDVCRQRREPRVILGNAGVVRVLAPGDGVTAFAPGQLAMLFSASVVDRYGYPEKALAYDAPDTMGCLATRMIVRPHELIAVPDGTRHTLPQWAVFSGSHITAWSNWELAFGALRLQLSHDELPAPHVWGWGGGTTLAELDLAHRHGCRVVAISSRDDRLAIIRALGLTPLDRREFATLAHDEKRLAADPEFRRAYLEAEQRFLREVDRLTDGDRVHIFVDYIGTPVYRATLRALARQGIITTAGWREGMVMNNLRAAECIGRHQHIHTHYARYAQGLAAIRYGEQHGWMPTMDARIYTFDEIPALARASDEGALGYYTAFSINPA